MLRVVSIIEGGLDLEKNQEIPRSIVVSNGKQSVTVPVPDSVVQELVDLLASEVGAAPTVKPAPLATRVKIEKSKLETQQLFEPELLTSNPAGFETDDFSPALAVEDDSMFEPGEEYDDGGTGVSSL
jgi:hypothetical protein